MARPRHTHPNIPSESDAFNLLSAHGMLSCHAVANSQLPGRLITSCCSSGLTQHL